jgi:anaerobic ribonucleoside-triphosphate reductase activating protein
MDVYGLRDWVLGIPGIEGLTISGGEPMQQADGLYLLVTLIHEKRPDFSIGIFSGYTEKQLEEGRWKWHSRATGEWIHGDGLVWAEIKKHLDFAIMGRFMQDLRCMDKPLCGSRNQEVVFFTDRYSAKDVKPTMVEMIISANDIITTGFPPPPEEETGDLVHA